jgi:hypothetical protein
MYDFDPRFETTLLPDGSFEVGTTDSDPAFAALRARATAELQAVLDAYRAGGVSRPVVFDLATDDPPSRRFWRRIEPLLLARGRRFFSTSPVGVSYAVRPDDARAILLPFCGKDSARFFRVGIWSPSFWTVTVQGDGDFIVCENCTPKDVALATAPPEGRGHGAGR